MVRPNTRSNLDRSEMPTSPPERRIRLPELGEVPEQPIEDSNEWIATGLPHAPEGIQRQKTCQPPT